jgi:hypothetical protein
LDRKQLAQDLDKFPRVNAGRRRWWRRRRELVNSGICVFFFSSDETDKARVGFYFERLR